MILIIDLVLGILTEGLASLAVARNLTDVFTYEGHFGQLLFLGWLMAWAILIVAGQILYIKDSEENYIIFSFGGLIIGAVALLVLGGLGWVGGWAQLLPVIGTFLGYVTGGIRDRAHNN